MSPFLCLLYLQVVDSSIRFHRWFVAFIKHLKLLVVGFRWFHVQHYSVSNNTHKYINVLRKWNCFWTNFKHLMQLETTERKSNYIQNLSKSKMKFVLQFQFAHIMQSLHVMRVQIPQRQYVNVHKTFYLQLRQIAAYCPQTRNTLEDLW